MGSQILKQSIVIAHHKASVSLEDQFWNGLKEIADAQHHTVSYLVTATKAKHEKDKPWLPVHPRRTQMESNAGGAGSLPQEFSDGGTHARLPPMNDLVRATARRGFPSV